MIEILNCGESQWPRDVRLICVNGFNKGKENVLPSLEPGKRVGIEIPLQAPGSFR